MYDYEKGSQRAEMLSHATIINFVVQVLTEEFQTDRNFASPQIKQY